MKKNENDIDNLIVRCLADQASPTEREALAGWMASSTENHAYYQKLKQVYELGGTRFPIPPSVQKIDVDQEWKNFITRVEREKITPVRTLNPLRSGAWLRIAASVLILIVSGFIVNYFVSKSSAVQFETANNTLEILLPDGSKATLNKYSELVYTNQYGKQDRKVEIKGEVFFEVARDAQKVFIIEKDEVTIEVLGTSFTVRGYETENLEVVVKTGKVKVSVSGQNQELILHAGDRGVYEKETKNLSGIPNTNVNFLAWKTREIIFEEADLQTVIELINDLYGSDIRIGTPVSAACVVTVTFKQQSLESILNVLKDTLNLTFSNRGEFLEITHAGC
ncbi:MAG: FecR domain-containing protein [Cyclobacteriaceae bacterium]|nr:FecR domain-containing protein [Cyclobacteriaceae bacterium]